MKRKKKEYGMKTLCRGIYITALIFENMYIIPFLVV